MGLCFAQYGDAHVVDVRERAAMIICLRTVEVPEAERAGFLAWIGENRPLREQHGILAELVLEPSEGTGETVVITAWPSHEVFDAWIATPDRDRLTASDTHQSVDYHPITRYEVVGGYLNLEALTKEQP
jgi:heme-degrading monooxygenase HmoA